MIPIETAEYCQDSPETLAILCLRKIVREPVNFSYYILPSELGNLIATTFRNYAIANKLKSEDCDEFFKNFVPQNAPLNKINISGLPLSAEFLYEFIKIYKLKLNELNIENCENVAHSEIIQHWFSGCTNNLKSLVIGKTFKEKLRTKNCYRHLFPDSLKLDKLVLHNINTDYDFYEDNIERTLNYIITPSLCASLKYLDLSMSRIGTGRALAEIDSLEILILYDCWLTYPDIITTTISSLKNLRTLDISKRVTFEFNPSLTDGEDVRLLDTLINNLPNLMSLDIAGTNLIDDKDRYMSAFERRIQRPFKFLGLFHTTNDAAYKTCIPAITVAGEANESQILNACEAYIDRPRQLEVALSDLYHFYKTITASETLDINRALNVVLPILTKHIHDVKVIIFTTASLYCIVRTNLASRGSIDSRKKRMITSRILDVMHYHNDNTNILINGVLTLLYLPDIICEHSRIASITLIMCQNEDPRTKAFGATLLNTLACQVGEDQKIFMGKLNAIEIMIDIIKSKIEENTCDEILETAWSTLWNITDETPVNCQKFLEVQGLAAFEDCIEKFGNNKEVTRNIMGLLGNVAECKHLRVNFMQSKYIKRFHYLTFCSIDGIECSYNACGILAHLISDGQEFWDQHETIDRRVIMNDMREVIRRWPINSRRNINYRSFEPIVRLLDTSVAPAAQYWAVFALTNLTRINPKKYCPMLIPFDGLKKLSKLAEDNVTEYYVRNLARIAIYQYDRFQEEGTLDGLEQCDSVDLEIVKSFRAESSNLDGISEMVDRSFHVIEKVHSGSRLFEIRTGPGSARFVLASHKKHSLANLTSNTKMKIERKIRAKIKLFVRANKRRIRR